MRTIACCCLMLWSFGNPFFGETVSEPGVFYVARYNSNAAHTDYDMARAAADAYAAANPWTGSVLVLKAGLNATCDAVPLPSLGFSSTTSIIGGGSQVTRIVKSLGCTTSAATLRHDDSPNGALSRAWYQGFTVDANHVDLAACEMYGMSLTTFIDVACGNAVAGADHELEFGDLDPSNRGWMDNIYIYDLRTFDSVLEGKGAILLPSWTSGALTAVRVANPGSVPYTKFVRAMMSGPGLSTCVSVPTLTVSLKLNGLVAGAIITNRGDCESTSRLFILIQDGTPVTYGMKFSNMADSHVWGLQASNSTTYGEAWLGGSANNSIYNEHPDGNQMIQVLDYANGNRHVAPIFTDPGGYAAGIYSQNGTIQDAILTWDDTSYGTASGYFVGNDPRVFQDWMIQDSLCGATANSDFTAVTTRSGSLSTSNPVPAGVTLQNIQICDGTGVVDWPLEGP